MVLNSDRNHESVTVKRPIMRGVLLVFFCFCSAASGLYAEGIESSDSAIVKNNAITVYSEMSTVSKRLKSLGRGEKVTVEIEVEGSEDTWCGIIERGQTAITGYVQCKYLEREAFQKRKWQPVASSVVRETSHETNVNETNVIIEGNSVLVPVSLGYKDKTIEALLLLDTGASVSVINTEIADQLDIKPAETKMQSGQVVGGGLILIFMAKLNYIAAGPHTKNKMKIGVVIHKGPPVKFDGLLGMDFLRGLKYYIDFKNRIIKWEQ